MIRYYTKQHGELVELERYESAHWVNITPPFNQEELEYLAQELDIPLDFLTDSLDIDERSRYEREDDVRLIVLNTPILNNAEELNAPIYITVPIGIILVGELIITITAFENPILKRFLKNTIRGFSPKDASLFVLQIFEQNVYRFLNCLKDLNLKRNLLEQELYDSSRNSELQELLRIEKSLVYFVTSLSANELMKMKMQRTNLLQVKGDEDKEDLFADIIIDNSQALEMANVYTNILSGTMDAFASIISNNLNIVMQRLTSITIVLMVPTVIASFFGMNVKNGLEEEPFAIYMIIIVSLFLSIFVAWFFRSRRMF
ncbi:MAG: magnesium transporter CorA family protein [Saprospiraceae bacterium]